jgi:predicted permease
VGARSDIWLPLALESAVHRTSGIGSLTLIGRLRSGVSLQQARAEMAVLFRWTLEERTSNSKDPVMRQLRFTVEPAGAGLSTALRYQFTQPLRVLMAVVGLLLLVACANLANMQLAQGASRQREMTLRLSLGATGSRLVRQVLTEALLLSTAGGVAGVILAYFGADALVRIMTSGRPMIGLPAHIEIRVRPDMDVLLFTAGVTFLTGVLFGLAPAWSAIAARQIVRPRRLFGKSLVVAQVALSVVLLSSAGLFVGYLWNLRNVDLGFDREHVLLLSLNPARSGYDADRLSRAYRELLSRLETIPGVRSATLSGTTPINGAAASGFAVAEGFEERSQDRRYVSLNQVAPKYFETLGTPLLAGRDFNFQDVSGRPRVAIVNRAMARYYFGEGNPIGKHVTLDHVTGGGNDQPLEIVGVVGDAKYLELHGAAPRTIYLSAFQGGQVPSQFSIRTSVKPASVADEVRRTVRELLPAVPVQRVTTLAEQVDASIVPERLLAGIAELFGGLGAALAAIGIYGLLAYTVARRIKEFGIRMALGATRAAVTRMVLGDALRMVCAGLAIGAPVAFWSKRLVASLIQDLPAGSSIPIIFGAAAMVAVAVLAAYVPARRAARVEPMEALRHG